MSDQESRQTVAGAYAKIEGHEELCAERYKNIDVSIGEIKDLIKLVRNGLFGGLVTLACWGLVQLYDGLKHPTTPLAAAAVAAVVAQPPEK